MAFFKRKKKKAVERTDPVKIMLGTCPSTKQDAEALARGMIERYFDITSNSWFFLYEEKDVGFHYEIHEAGEGRPLLPSILEIDAWGEGVSYTFKPQNEHAIEVYCKENKTIATIVMTKGMSEGAEVSDGIYYDKSKRMKPYVTMGTEWVMMSLIALGLGLVSITSGGIIHKSFDIATKGYVELLDTLPTSRLLDLSDMTKRPDILISPVSSLPISQWDRLLAQTTSSEHVSKLTYDGKVWKIDKVANNENSKPASTVSDQPEVSIGNDEVIEVAPIKAEIPNDSGGMIERAGVFNKSSLSDGGLN